MKTTLDVPAAQLGQLCHPGGTAKHEALVTSASKVQAEDIAASTKDAL